MNDKLTAIQISQEHIRKLELRKIELENFTPVTFQQEEQFNMQLEILEKEIKHEREYLAGIKKNYIVINP